MFMIIIDDNNYKAFSSFIIETTRAKGPSSLMCYISSPALQGYTCILISSFNTTLHVAYQVLDYQ